MAPYRKSDIEQIEKVQKRATKLVVSLRNLPYKERLMRLNLHTLKYTGYVPDSDANLSQAVIKKAFKLGYLSLVFDRQLFNKLNTKL